MDDSAIKLRIDLPLRSTAAVITNRDPIANLLIAALERRGYRYDSRQPSRWGFGAVTRRVHPRQRLWAVQRIYVGSSDPEIVTALAQIQPDDLVEPNAVSGSGLHLQEATIYRLETWLPCESVQLYTISPLRVTDRTAERPGDACLETGPRFDDLLNRAMARRFGREFRLRLVPDSLYVRSRQGRIEAGMGVKADPRKGAIIKKGIVLPFLLCGPPADLRDAWYSGLGSGTARGFGCVEMAI